MNTALHRRDANTGARYILYSHDTYGLGHFRRCSLIAHGIVDTDPSAEVLIVTGSPEVGSFNLSERIDALKLPSATKGANGAYKSRSLRLSLRDLREVRSWLIRAAIDSYRPDVVLVDHAPIGMAGELMPVLSELGSRADRPRLVLGLRDVIDDAERVDEAWTRHGVWPMLDHYDEVFVYADSRFTTTAKELHLDRRLDRPVTHVGFVAPTPLDGKSPDRPPVIVVTAGGGGDGSTVLRSAVEAIARSRWKDEAKTVIVTGPLMPKTQSARLSALAHASLASVDVMTFTPNMRQLLADATAVISMAGYNTVVEEMVACVPALLVPRRQPRLEQAIRAARIRAHGPFEVVTDEDLDNRALDQHIDRVMAMPTRIGTLALDGVARVVSRLSGSTGSILHHRRGEMQHA